MSHFDYLYSLISLIFKLFTNKFKLHSDHLSPLRVSEIEDCKREPVIWSRPLGPTESYFLRMGRGRGWADPFLTCTFSYQPSSVRQSLSERTRLAWAILRARHPLLASIVMGEPGAEDFMCLRPADSNEALFQANKSFEHIYCAPSDFQQELDSLRARWGGPLPEYTLASNMQLSRCALIENSDEGGLHAISIYGTHFIADAFAIMGLIKELLGIIASTTDPTIMLDDALGEGEHFPPSIDELIEEQRSKNHPGPEVDAIEAYKIFSEPSRLTRHGLVPDGTSSPDRISQIVDRRTFSFHETSALIKASKAHGASVTSVISAALSLVACDMNPAPTTEKSYGKLHLPIDLSSRGASGGQQGRTEAALRAGRYPIWVDLTPTDTASRDSRFWELCKICQNTQTAFISSPFFWDFLVYYSDDSLAVLKTGPPPPNTPPIPILPLLSSVGRLDSVVPSTISDSANSNKVVIDDLIINMKVLPVVPSVHVWTYAGKLNAQLTYNSGFTSKVMMDDYWNRVVELLRQAGTWN